MVSEINKDNMMSYYNFNIIEECKHCLHDKGLYEDVSVFFKYLQFDQGSNMGTESLPQNYILAFLSGEHEVNINIMETQILKSGDLLCVPKNSKVWGKPLASGDIVAISFEVPLSSCDQQIIHEYLSSSPMKDLRIEPLKMEYAVNQFFGMMVYLITNEKNCYHLDKMKLDEFFILLRSFYTKEDIVRFLGPLILGMTEFSIYICSNYGKVENLQALISKSCYSRSVFYRKFRENFGSITPQRWFNLQKRNQFLSVGSLPDITPKKMMLKLNLNSMSTMSRLCRELFGCTPKQLIERLKK